MLEASIAQIGVFLLHVKKVDQHNWSSVTVFSKQWKRQIL